MSYFYQSSNDNCTMWSSSIYGGTTVGGNSVMLNDNLEDINSLRDANSVEDTVPAGALVMALTTSLIVGIPPSFAQPDTWSFDCYITPNDCHLLGSGDHIFIYHRFYDASITPSPLPVLEATLTDIVVTTGKSSHCPSKSHDFLEHSSGKEHSTFTLVPPIHLLTLPPPYTPTSARQH
ncbi:uncharacterized protein EDB91DRAFT_1247606 [Suillus paluster]|uniref:uncharacterized protein n=1 Tax=Suillus paluster TaxID=48578 RepID=UPI001B87E563|nr:uncharacterized protein EDB91DRAFT_1247606 [Suillus paluster]KAG1742790.1 hypothetical protein EDB91DRAFT_1247606 [Suillus paluster]